MKMTNNEIKKVKRLLVLYVGGTIGMKKNDKGVYEPAPNFFIEKLKSDPQMHSLEAAKYFDNLESNQLVLVTSKDRCALLYEIKEYHPLLDSSEMSHNEWIRIAKDIEENYKKFDGFVILHGTDTMAFSASALSFILNGLEKPVILTGSQIPIFETRSDAKGNILSSLILAGCYNIPEVAVYFSSKLMRGNRTTKFSSNQLNAFDSPNFYPLADVGIDITFNHFAIRKAKGPLNCCLDLNPNVGMIVIHPTITAKMLASFLQPPIEGLVIKSYGSGNIPTRDELLEVLGEAVERGVVIVNVTQCNKGAVSCAYQGGKLLEDMGIIPGGDMTAEAALTKLCYVLGIPKINYNKKIELMKTDLRGELTIINDNNQ